MFARQDFEELCSRVLQKVAKDDENLTQKAKTFL